MRIRNFIVDNIDVIINHLEEELCKNGISYVKIDNEFHFQNQIIRFYDFEMDKRLIISMFFSNYEKEMLIMPNESVFLVQPNTKVFIPLHDTDKLIFTDKCYQSRNKSIQKYESNKVKQKLKMYKK